MEEESFGRWGVGDGGGGCGSELKIHRKIREKKSETHKKVKQNAFDQTIQD